MIDWNNANGMQMAIVIDALLDAIREPNNMQMLVNLQLNKSYRQLVGDGVPYDVAVFQITDKARAGGWLDQLIDAARQRVPGNARLKALKPLSVLTQVPAPAGRTVEDIVRQDGGFQDVTPWMRRLDALRAQVCRIEYPVNQAAGTGWLVGRDLVLTNWHVVREVLAKTKDPKNLVLRFDYGSDDTETNPGVTFPLASDWCLRYSPASPLELGEGGAGPTPAQLDYALLKLADPVGDQAGPNGSRRDWIKTRRAVPPPAQGDILFVLQHPAGDPLKLAIGVAAGTNPDGTRVSHNANTINGSSGSPCLNARLELIALHNAGDPLYDGVTGKPKQNQAVPLEKILANVETAGGPQFWSS